MDTEARRGGGGGDAGEEVVQSGLAEHGFSESLLESTATPKAKEI